MYAHCLTKHIVSAHVVAETNTGVKFASNFHATLIAESV